jgi:hypothetical protein
MSKFTLTRRALVASTAVMPAVAMLGLPAAAEPAAPDPIFAAMVRYQSTSKAFYARCTYENDLERAGQKLTPAPGEYRRTSEMVAVVNASIAGRKELAAASPTTLPGLLSYLRFVHERSVEEEICLFDGDDETLIFIESIGRSARALGAAALPALAGTAAVAITPDPIFAAIEHFRAASDVHSAACEGEPSSRHPEYREWYSRQTTACHAQQDALDAMLQVRPTTKAGAVAVIEVYLQHYRDEPSEEGELLKLIGQAIPHLV